MHYWKNVQITLQLYFEQLLNNVTLPRETINTVPTTYTQRVFQKTHKRSVTYK